MLEISHLSKHFGVLQAVADLSLTIKSGEIFALIGPNGAGKSTTVKIIAGLLRPTSGSITIDGHSVVSAPLRAKAVLGYAPDEPAVWSGITGEEFLHLTGALYGMQPAERQAAMQPLLEAFNITGLRNTYFEEYSRGNKQKFSLVAALLHKPKLLVVDEPIVGLDPASVEIAMRLLREYTQTGGAVLLVAHTLQVVEELADRIGVLKESTLVASGTLAELRSQAHCEATDPLSSVYTALTT